MPEIHNEPAEHGEFERRIRLADIGAGESLRAIAANERELGAIATRLNLVSVESFDVSVKFRTVSKGKSVDVRGILNATVRQHCVSTLQPIVRTYQEEFSVRFVGPQDALTGAPQGPGKQAQELILEMDARDIENLDNEEFDIGEVAVQYLALALDPYPHVDGAAPADWSDRGHGGVERGAKGHLESQSPFAVLKKLQDKT